MKTALIAAAIFAAAAICEAKQHSSFRAHTEASANNGPVFSTEVRLFGRTVTIEKVPTLSERDVIGFKSYRAADGTYGVLFELSPHGRLALDTLSVERRGRSLFVFVNGRPITELQIDRRVSDGKIYIPSGLTSDDVELFKKDWPPRKGH